MNTTSVSRGYVRFGRILSGIHSEPSTVGLLSPRSDPARYRVLLDAGKASELGLAELPPALIRQADEVLR